MMLHVSHLYKAETGMAMATTCDFLSNRHYMYHWKRVLKCCYECSNPVIPVQESTSAATNTCLNICFHINIYWYHAQQ